MFLPNGHHRIGVVITPNLGRLDQPIRRISVDGKVLPEADSDDAMLKGHLLALDGWLASEGPDGQD